MELEWTAHGLNVCGLLVGSVRAWHLKHESESLIELAQRGKIKVGSGFPRGHCGTRPQLPTRLWQDTILPHAMMCSSLSCRFVAASTTLYTEHSNTTLSRH